LTLCFDAEREREGDKKMRMENRFIHHFLILKSISPTCSFSKNKKKKKKKKKKKDKRERGVQCSTCVNLLAHW
jgi:ssDNA-binding Zn-finger/Zn-ribbon topoisomerase 1